MIHIRVSISTPALVLKSALFVAVVFVSRPVDFYLVNQILRQGASLNVLEKICMSTICRNISVILIVSLWVLGQKPAVAAEWVPAGGNVYFGTTPLCAQVLINGQSQFSCDGSGRYDMDVPLDGNGMITVQVFADGFAPFKQILTPEQASAYQVNMIRVVQGIPSIEVNAKYSDSASEGWVIISGTVNSGENPVCALILANGQKMFSCGDNLGVFSLEVPLDQDGAVTLMVFAAGFQPYKNRAARLTSLSAGTGHTCVLADGEPVCWGGNENEYGQLIAPPLTNPSTICAGGSHTCALDTDGVKCWGAGTSEIDGEFQHSGQSMVPKLSNPRSLSCGLWATCAIDDSGTQCWGMGGSSMTPGLMDPLKVRGGSNAACAISANSVECSAFGVFEEDFRAMMDEPSLIEPIDIDTSAHSACAIDRDGVVCWGDDDWGIENMPPLNNPVQVELGADFACAMDDNGVICWGREGNYFGPPKLENPRSISVGDYHACALDGDGIVCWGSNPWGAVDIPDYLRAD
jgi:hypothetical protein